MKSDTVYFGDGKNHGTLASIPTAYILGVYGIQQAWLPWWLRQ